MKKNNMYKFLFLSLVVSTLTTSCGFGDKSTTPDQPTDSKSGDPSAPDATALDSEKKDKTDPGSPDDLFSKTMDEKNLEAPLAAQADAPSNITSEPINSLEDKKTLESEFPANDSQPKTSPKIVAENIDAGPGQAMTYKVKKGETLMQIAFKIYGDVTKWKEIKKLNQDKVSKDTSLQNEAVLKYIPPAEPFVWNPEGNPYLIKTGETLGTISNTVYQTPKKWKSIYENNRPLIKNPNLIFAGFTLYYKGKNIAGVDLFPEVEEIIPFSNLKKETTKELKKELPKTTQSKNKDKSFEKAIEEVKIDEVLSKLDNNGLKDQPESEIDLTREVQSAITRENVQDEETDTEKTNE